MSKSDTKTDRWNVLQLFGLERDKTSLYELMCSERLHPVILLEGRQGLGKRHLAVWMAARLLCEQKITLQGPVDPCGKCGACREVLSGLHHDVMIINEPGASIRTADAEVFQEHFNTLSATGRRLGLLMNADKMTMEAANRLLKTLEEPPAQAFIILTSSRPLSLPPTILGRCLRWRLQAPDRDQVVEWTRKLLHGNDIEKLGANEVSKFVQHMAFSPGRIRKAIEHGDILVDDLAEDVRALLGATTASEVLKIAADVARTKKAKLSDVLDYVELELSSQYRQSFEGETNRVAGLTEMARTRRFLREALSSARRHAVIGKVSLNTQLVMESLGLSRWKEGVL